MFPAIAGTPAASWGSCPVECANGKDVAPAPPAEAPPVLAGKVSIPIRSTSPHTPVHAAPLAHSPAPSLDRARFLRRTSARPLSIVADSLVPAQLALLQNCVIVT